MISVCLPLYFLYCCFDHVVNLKIKISSDAILELATNMKILIAK